LRIFRNSLDPWFRTLRREVVIWMHIPDGYLSPATCAVGFAVAVPIWAVGARRVNKTVKTRQVPTLALLSAMCFLIMMFNVPIPDGTTAHAVGGALVAVLLGPWAALIAVSVALAFQALLFGDGGVLAYGVNVVNMGIVLPFIAYGMYRVLARGSTLTSPRRAVAAGVAGYIGINAAALCCGIELGLQPTLFHTADGQPLYSPYHLAQSVPAMLLAHLAVAGVVEGLLTGGVVAYVQRANVPLLRVNHPNVPVDDAARVRVPLRLKPVQVALAAVAAMAVLTPVGLLAPGGAFGENAPEDLDLAKYHLSAIPTGLAKWNGLWHHAIFNGYDFSNDKHPTLGYLLSAVVGIVVIGVAVFVIAWVARQISISRHPDRSSGDSRADGHGSGAADVGVRSTTAGGSTSAVTTADG
jgi:cobalt/nickel transport system permease protein